MGITTGTSVCTVNILNLKKADTCTDHTIEEVYKYNDIHTRCTDL